MKKNTTCKICGIIFILEIDDVNDKIIPICSDCWKCPNCDVGSDPPNLNSQGFIDEIEETGFCNCYECDKSYTLNSLIKQLQKKVNVMPCPHCKGTGIVSRDAK